jgi:predicted HAD superfamily Cof-like phosphohydrolase
VESLTPQQEVDEFHKATGSTIGYGEPKIRDGLLRINLIEEEADEFRTAVEDNDLIGAIDALCDLLYVVYGAGTTFGVDLAPFFAEVHRSNMSKVAAGLAREDGKILKGDEYSPPDLRRVMKEYMNG